jgi:hypothetical protein
MAKVVPLFICRAIWKKDIPQGLKPIHSIALIGTTEVVPCYKTTQIRIFPQPVKARQFEAGIQEPEGSCSLQKSKKRKACS